MNNKNVSCPSTCTASPAPEREARGHWGRRGDSWAVRAGRGFRGQPVQHQVSQIRKVRFGELNARSRKDYMRPVTSEAGPGTSK